MSAPPLFRTWKLLRLLSTLVVVAVVLLTLAAVANAVDLLYHGVERAYGSGAAGPAVRLGSSLDGTTLVDKLNLSVPNHGFLPITSPDVVGSLFNGTTAVGSLAGPPVSLAPGSTANLSLTADVLLTGPVGEFLTTHNASLATNVWINGTYAWLYGFAVHVNFTFPWTPPFGNLSYVAGPFTPQGNGTQKTELTVAFLDEGVFLNLTGTLRATVIDVGGTDCGSVAFPLSNTTGPVLVTEPLWLAGSCPTTGDTVASVYDGAGAPLALPSEAMG